MLAAWARRNSRQLGPDLRGAGPSPARASSRRIVVGDTRNPSWASSPPIRRWPQRGFSRASSSTKARTSAWTRGRPRLPGAWRHFRRTSARCHRKSVRGVTRRAPREEAGGWAGRRREHGPMSRAKLRRRALAAQHRDLVAQDQQLEVLGVQATATPNECAQQGPERDIEEGEGHYRDPPTRPRRARHEYWRPTGALRLRSLQRAGLR